MVKEAAVVTIHACELTLNELMDTRKKLFTSDSTDENIKKLEAIDRQIARHKAVKGMGTSA